MTRFNACEYLLDRRIAAGDGARLALTGAGRRRDATPQLHERVRAHRGRPARARPAARAAAC